MKMELQDLEELGNGSRSFSVPNVSLVSMNHSFTFEKSHLTLKYQINSAGYHLFWNGCGGSDAGTVYEYDDALLAPQVL